MSEAARLKRFADSPPIKRGQGGIIKKIIYNSKLKDLAIQLRNSDKTNES
jgi:hypothetical protein